MKGIRHVRAATTKCHRRENLALMRHLTPHHLPGRGTGAASTSWTKTSVWGSELHNQNKNQLTYFSSGRLGKEGMWGELVDLCSDAKRTPPSSAPFPPRASSPLQPLRPESLLAASFPDSVQVHGCSAGLGSVFHHSRMF